MLPLTLVLLTAGLASGHCKGYTSHGLDSADLVATQAGHDVSHRRSLQAAAGGIKGCVWDGAECTLRRDFVKDLPGVFGSANTTSAKLLADAALRAAVCSNFTGKPQCLDAPSYSCDWDTALNRCTLGELLNYTMLSGVAFCPDSPLDQAFRCATELNSGCASSPHNCTLMSGTSPLNPLASLLGGGSDRLVSTVMGTIMNTMTKYGMSGVTGAAAAVGQLLTAISQALAGNSEATVQVCVAAWMNDSDTMSRLGQRFSGAVQSNNNLLAAFLNTDLAGSCTNGTDTLPLLAAATACGNASASAAACAAAAGCRWVATSGGAGSCTVGSDILPRLVLDPSDRWVKVLDNATALCRSLINETSCAATAMTINYTQIYNATAGVFIDDATIVIETSLSNSGGSGGGGRGGDSGGGAAAAASWWLVAVATAVAMALSAAVRQL